MVKKQKKVSASVEARRKKRKTPIPLVKNNPFEVRVNRLKHQVMGQKIKTDRGVPGVSRSKSNEKRKKILLKEYKQRFKNNAIIDKRFGEYDESLSIEDKMLKRYALEKQRHHEKSDLYNLGDDDDEMLTHYGQNLGDLENFDDAGLKLTDDEDEDINDNFGGFLTKKKKDDRKYDDAGEQLAEKRLTKQEVMDQIVANSKKKKFERQQTQEQAFELTQQLDSQLRDILPLLSRKNHENVKQQLADDYDRTVNELFFESKAKATDRLKTDGEIAREEKEKLEELERQRLDRMLGDIDEGQQEQSADALITKRKKAADDRMEVHYRDGKIVLPDGVTGLLAREDDEDSDEEEFSGNEGKGDVKDEEGEQSDDSEDEDSDSDHEDLFSDDDDDDDDDEDSVVQSLSGEDEEIVKLTKKSTQKKKAKSNKEMQEKAKGKKASKQQNVDEELPYVFDAPACLDDFLEVTKDRSDKEVLIILKRIRKCHHVKLDSQNKQKMGVVFDVLLKYMDHICNLPKPRLKLINSLAEFLDTCVEDIPDHVTKSILKKLKNTFKRIQLRMKVKGKNGVFPALSELIFFKVVSLLYPTSDLNHVVTTPAIVLMTMLFSKAHCVHLKDVVSGLFLLNIAHDYIKLSKRYLPEVISFIAKLLYFAAPTSESINKISASVLNVRREEHSFLLVERKSTSSDPTQINLPECLAISCDPSSLNTDQLRISCIRNVLLLTKKYCNLYTDLSSYNEIFQPCASLMERLPLNKYPKSLANLHEEVLTLLKSKSDQPMIPLTMQSRKPVPLPLLEPEFDEHYEYRSKSRFGDKAQNELKKLKYKVKKETKGAMREIRKDAHFLAKEQLKERVDRDNARKEKVKDLQRTIENERREIKEMEKKGGI